MNAPTDTLTLTGAQTLVRLLQAENTPAAFGIVGGKLAPLLHALSQSPIPFVGVRHEAAAPMMAALSGEKGAVVAVSYDARSGKMMVAPTTLDPGKGDAELWIIPAGGTPVSLGIVDAKLAQVHNVPAERRTYVQPGATFAITQEVKGGSPSGQPAGPIVASGKIIRT